MKSHDLFRDFTGSLKTGHALHLGTLRSDPLVSTLEHGKRYFPAGWSHVGTDIEPGLDVDIVADLHQISAGFRGALFDAIIGLSVFEHLARPWIVARELAGITRPGGYAFVQTHQTFPIHAYPSDYWRFTNEAMRVLFSPENGWETLAADYEFPCTIHAEDGIRTNAYLNVVCTARRL